MYTVIIPAAGAGTRMKLGYNKLFHKIAQRTIIEHTVDCFLKDAKCAQIIITTSIHDQLKMNNLFNKCPHIEIILGGETRQESILNALDHVREKTVLVHDGARPFVNARIIKACYEAALTGAGAVACVPVKDTIKQRHPIKKDTIATTLIRDQLILIQTPQAFPTDVLRQANAYAKNAGTLNEATDDASLVEKYTAVEIKIVDGDYKNIKFTTSEDIAYFEFLMKKERM